MNSITQAITDQIIEALENNVIPWKKPWNTELPMNLLSRHVYRGINLLTLCLSPHASPYYLTFKQLASLGGTVKKGSKGFKVVYWDKMDAEDEEQRMVVKYYNVFNVEQCLGIPERFLPQDDERFDSLAACEEIIDNMPEKPEIKEALYAFYCLKSDVVGLPHRRNFVSIEEYYSTLFHELVHSTGHSKRLNRRYPQEILRLNEDYSREELVAEIGSSFLCGHARISPKTISNQAGYISGWLSALKGERRMILSAASMAQKAVDYIMANTVEEDISSE